MGLAYIYANQKGCDGERTYYDGSSMIALNGDILALDSQFSLDEIEPVIAVFDLEDIRLARAKTQSIGAQSSAAPSYKRIQIDFNLSVNSAKSSHVPSISLNPKFHSVEEEIS